LGFNFFLVKPYYTFHVADPRDVLDLFVFFAAATLTGQLASYARRQAEHAQRSQAFEEADRLKTALLHAVSHDLRTPITIIKTSASNLLTFYSTLPENERVDMLKVIENEADHLNKMVGNLLDISRLKAGALQMNQSWNSLEEVAGDVAARVWQLTHQERIHICFPDSIPLVYFDYGLILQALSNLIENSLRYEPSDQQIDICGEPVKDEMRVFVRNHGPNISAEERDLIFEPFYHGASGNIGLGLAIAKGIVEAHGGCLWIEDTPGGGATFIFSLPLEEQPK
jgi:two-component system sensor histidine kinase KdpD